MKHSKFRKTKLTLLLLVSSLLSSAAQAAPYAKINSITQPDPNSSQFTINYRCIYYNTYAQGYCTSSINGTVKKISQSMGTNISYDYGPGIHNVIITAYEAVPNTRGNIAYKPHSSSSSITINLPNIEVDKITKYSYDTLGRLINVDDGNNQSEYIYDKAGNRISKATTKN